MKYGLQAEKSFFLPQNDLPAPHILFVQHFNLLCDPRMAALKRAIEATVRPGDNVLDLGSGTGIMAMLAARQAARVFAVEADPHLARYSQRVIDQNGLSHKITVINGNALEIDLPGRADVIICEMLDTGLIKEPQVPVMNRAVKHLAREDARIIPRGAVTSLVLSSSDFNFAGFCLPLPYFETLEVRKTGDYFSLPVPCHTVDFRRQNPLHVCRDVDLGVTRQGTVNSFKMVTSVELCPGQECGPSPWFNPPLVLPVEPLFVSPGDLVRVSLSYELGAGLQSLDYRIGVK
jgi:predicted RNA methylase